MGIRYQMLLILRQRVIPVHLVMPIKALKLKAELKIGCDLHLSASWESVWKMERERGLWEVGDWHPGRKEGPLASVPMSSLLT